MRWLLRLIRANWSTVAFWLRLGAVAWVALIAVVSGLQFFGYVPDLPKLDAVAWGISLGLLGVDNLASVIMKHVRKIRADRNRKIELALMALLIGIARATPDVRFEDLGANVFEINGDNLKRIHRFRPAGPQRSGINWTKKKGAVGACATHSRTTHVVWHPIAKVYAGGVVEDVSFGKMSSKTKSGFEIEDFNAISSKYSEVLAEPIWHSGKERTMIGVLTIDRVFRPEDDGFIARLGDRLAKDSAAASASVVADIMQPRAAEGD